jgi:hypothetical protein
MLVAPIPIPAVALPPRWPPFCNLT